MHAGFGNVVLETSPWASDLNIARKSCCSLAPGNTLLSPDSHTWFSYSKHREYRSPNLWSNRHTHYMEGMLRARYLLYQIDDMPVSMLLTSTAATLLRGRIWDISVVCRVHKKVGRYLRMTLSPMLVSQRCRRTAHGAQESVVTLKTLCVSCHLNTLHGTKGPLNNGCQTTFLGHRIPRPVSLSML